MEVHSVANSQSHTGLHLNMMLHFFVLFHYNTTSKTSTQLFICVFLRTSANAQVMKPRNWQRVWLFIYIFGSRHKYAAEFGIHLHTFFPFFLYPRVKSAYAALRCTTLRCVAVHVVKSLWNDHVTPLAAENSASPPLLSFVLALSVPGHILPAEKHASHVKPRLKITNQLLRYDPPDLCAAYLSLLICGQRRFKRNWPLLCCSLE